MIRSSARCLERELILLGYSVYQCGMLILLLSQGLRSYTIYRGHGA
jgi:hypothetical protein